MKQKDQPNHSNILDPNPGPLSFVVGDWDDAFFLGSSSYQWQQTCNYSSGKCHQNMQKHTICKKLYR